MQWGSMQYKIEQPELHWADNYSISYASLNLFPPASLGLNPPNTYSKYLKNQNNLSNTIYVSNFNLPSYSRSSYPVILLKDNNTHSNLLCPSYQSHLNFTISKFIACSTITGSRINLPVKSTCTIFSQDTISVDKK